MGGQMSPLSSALLLIDDKILQGRQILLPSPALLLLSWLWVKISSTINGFIVLRSFTFQGAEQRLKQWPVFVDTSTALAGSTCTASWYELHRAMVEVRDKT